MSQARLLVVTALLEAGAGLALLLAPALAVSLLLGVSESALEVLVITRVAGAALLTLGIACWLVRTNHSGRGVAAIIPAMLTYNTLVAAILAFAGIADRLNGYLLWPAVLLHIAMAAWCVNCVRGKRIDLIK